ncbi:hypothetical protein FRC07_013636 [Ceratobasidium sp. 392]|nr:hypothetical protein FRC07_013636 [Ceratobasidium sp. 392]
MSYNGSLSPPPILTEDEVLNALDILSNSAITEARGKGLISTGGGPPVTVTGSALCLYYAAVRSETGRPSVALPYNGGIPKRLQYNTCPPNFHHLFQRWEEIVPRIQELSLYHRTALEHVLCGGSPAPLPYSSPAGYGLVHWIAQVLYTLAQDISDWRHLRIQHRRAYSVPNINTSSPWPAPFTASPVDTISPMLRHPAPQPQSRNSIFVYPQSSGSPTSYSPPDSLTPTPSANNTITLYSPVLSPGSTNDRGLMIGGFAVPERGLTVPAQGFVNPNMSFPSPQPFGTPGPSPIDNRYQQNIGGNLDFSPSWSYNQPSSANSTVTVIGSGTSKPEVVGQLRKRGCPDLTGSLDPYSFLPQPISRGGFGEVHRGKLRDGTPIAVKIMYAHGEYEESKHVKHTAREVHTWSKCNHPNVARLMGIADYNNRLAIVSLWMENGHLRRYVAKYPHVDRLKLCTQIADGLEYLHSIEIVHGDLKGSNVLISDDGDPVLIDFGSSIQSNATLQFTNNGTSQGMTMRWTAPELFNDCGVNKATDVYALGMETFTGKEPFNLVKSDPAIMNTVLSKKIPDRPQEIPDNIMWSDMLWRLLVNCWAYEPLTRPTAPEVHSHVAEVTGRIPTPTKEDAAKALAAAIRRFGEIPES